MKGQEQTRTLRGGLSPEEFVKRLAEKPAFEEMYEVAWSQVSKVIGFTFLSLAVTVGSRIQALGFARAKNGCCLC